MSASDLLLGAAIGAGAVYFYKRRRGGFGEFAIEAKRRSASDPETGGWAPGWWRARDRFKTRAEANAAIKKRGKKGAKFRVISLDGCGCDF